MLTSYTDLVNDLNGINNYADNVKVLTSQIVEKDCTKWESNLNSLDIDELLKPLSCEKKCTNISDMKNQLNMLFEKNEEPAKSNNPGVTNMQQTCPFGFKKKVENNLQPNSSHFQQQSSNYAKTNVLQSSNNVNKYGGSKPYENRSTLSRNFSDIRNYTSTTTTSNRNNSQEDEKKSNRYNMFKTAKDELQEQSIKNYGKSNGNSYHNVNPGVKKTLGTRRGVNSKFVSPLLVEDE